MRNCIRNVRRRGEWRVACTRVRACVCSVVNRDYCEAETFNVSCAKTTTTTSTSAGPGSLHEVLLIRHALYGRMKLGRCVLHDYGYVGCYANVTSHLETLCTGNVSCQVHIPDAGLDKANPCPRDLKTYLQVSYECVPGSLT